MAKAARPLRPEIKDGAVLEYIPASSISSPFSTSSAVPRASISIERVPKSNTGKYKKRGNSYPKNMSRCDRIEEFPGGKFVSPGFRPQKRLILISFVNHLAFRGAHMRICDAKDCKTGRWTI